MEFIKEFFGIGGYRRQAEGYLSWQHLAFVTALMALMILLAEVLGRRNRNRDDHEKNKALIVSAIAIDVIEAARIIFVCIRSGASDHWKYVLPLFLCSIPLFALPLCAFTRGRIKEASLDFMFIFGLLVAFMGTYGAGNNYSSYPVLSFDNVISGITHWISGFAALYIAVSGMLEMKRRNVPVTFAIIMIFCGAAYTADRLIPYNYMFLVRGDGTPYDIFYNLVNGNQVLYPLIVVALFLVYISVFYLVYFRIEKLKKRLKKN